MSAGFVADVGEYLTQENSQMKEEKEDSMIVLSPWYKNIKSLESKFVDKEQKLDVAEGDIFKDIQKVWVEAISIAVSGVMSTIVPEAISTRIFGAISRVRKR